MSTRSQITIEGQPIYFYKHSDGYPEGVLPTLEPFVAHFFKHRGYDPVYFIARLCMAFGEAERRSNEEFAANRLARGQAPFDYDDECSCLGYGLDLEIHGDIEYLYVVSAKGKITVKTGNQIKRHRQVKVQFANGRAV